MHKNLSHHTQSISTTKSKYKYGKQLSPLISRKTKEEEKRNKAGTDSSKTVMTPITNKPVAIPKATPIETAKPTETEEPNGGTVSSLDEFLSTTPEKETPVPKIKPLEEKVVEPVNNVITQKNNLTLTDEESDDDDFFDDFFDN